MSGKYFLQAGEYESNFFVRTFIDTLRENYEDVPIGSFLLLSQKVDGIVKHKDTGKRLRITKWANSDRFIVTEVE